MKEVHVLVDLENNQPTLEDVARLVPELTDIWLFHSKHQLKRLESFDAMGDKSTKIPISRPGKNSLDFHLAFYLGYIASKHPTARLVVMAIDGGYDPMLLHAQQLGFEVNKVSFKKKTSVARQPAPAKRAPKAGKVSPATNGLAATKTSPERKGTPTKKNAAPAKKALAKRAPAKKLSAAKKAQPAAKAASAKKPSATKAKALQEGVPGKTSIADLGKLHLKLVDKLKMLGRNRATKLNKLRAQITSVLGLKDQSGQVVDDLLDGLMRTGVVQASDAGRLQYTFG